MTFQLFSFFLYLVLRIREWSSRLLKYWESGLFPRVKRPGRCNDHSTSFSAEVNKGVELYPYLPSGPSWPVLGWNGFVNGLTISLLVTPQRLVYSAICITQNGDLQSCSITCLQNTNTNIWHVASRAVGSFSVIQKLKRQALAVGIKTTRRVKCQVSSFV
jgi:hypothetical protein